MEMRVGNTETFVIPTSSDTFIAYSPLNGMSLLIDREAKGRLVDVAGRSLPDIEFDKGNEWIKNLLTYKLPDIQKVLRQHPDEYTTLSLLPGSICNFRCGYCYSAEGRSSKIIDKQKLKQGLDFFINPDRIKPQTIKMFISGGGEPFMSWDDTRFAISYAHERAKEQGFTLWTSIITNGSIINEEIVRILKKYKCSICVSFEVLEDIQDKLRAQCKKVAKNIILYGEAGVPVMLNSTITPLSVDRMGEMMDEVFTNYSFVRNYTLEPVTDHTQFDSSESLRKFYDQFFENYKMIKEKYTQSSPSLWFSLEEMADTIKMRYCPGKLCLTPDATFSICHCVSSPLEERYEESIYGEITPEGVVFDESKFRSLIAFNAHNRDKCRDCFAKWNCGGECMTRWAQYPEKYMDEVCAFNRKWLKQQLEDRMARV
jgi:radical SAM protein with 4Fe4S-binding SPASM domain